MMVVVMVMVMALRSAHHAFDAANDAPGDSTDNAADRRANRARRAPAFGGASLTASNDALSLRDERRRKRGENDSGFDQAGFHEQTPFSGQSPTQSVLFPVGSPPLVINPLKSPPVPRAPGKRVRENRRYGERGCGDMMRNPQCEMWNAG